MNTSPDRTGTAARKPWTAPAIRTIVPVDRTRGGAFDLNDQDDAFYKIS